MQATSDASGEPRKRAGFAMGARWGLRGLGLAARRPVFCLAGLLMLAAAIGVAWIAGAVGVGIALALTVSGVACAGAAARAAADRVGGRSPWGAWIQPWRAGNRARHAARVAVCLGGLFVLGFASQQLMVRAEGSAAALSDTAAWGGRLGVCAAMLAWLVVAAGPTRGFKGSMLALRRAVCAPLALVGFGLFWCVFVGLFDALIAGLLSEFMTAAPGSKATADGVGALAVFATLILSAPLVAMSAGLASLDLDAGIDAGSADGDA